MRTLLVSRNSKIVTFAALAAIFVSIAAPEIASQTPSSAPASQPGAPRLTSEQRREFALLQQKVMGDAEYSAAVKRAIEAQKVADSLFFAKMAKSASPELQGYIKFLQQARSASHTQPKVDSP